MSITSGGQSYNPSYPVANVNNSTKGFRDNFATIKFAIEKLQTAKSVGAPDGEISPTSNDSIMFLSAKPDLNTGLILLKAEFNSTGFSVPANRPASPALGTICHENGLLYFYNGTMWQNFIERVGDTVTLPNIVATNKVTLNYVPSSPTDAVSVQWVQDYLATLPSGGTDPAVYARLLAVESGLSDEITVRAQEDSLLRDLINVESVRNDGQDATLVSLGQQLDQTRNTLNLRMDSVEDLANQVSSDFSELSQVVGNAVAQVDALTLEVEDALALERAERIAASDALSARIDVINDVIIADLSAEIEAERQARSAADQILQTGLTATNTNLNTERAARIAQGNVQQNSIVALADAVDQANAIVMGVGSRIDVIADDLITERTNREAGDLAERLARQNAVQALTGSIAAESTARQNADQVLGGNIAAESTARQNADQVLGGNIAAESTARQNADSVLSGEIAAESAARAGDVQSLQSDIAAESAARDQAIQNEAAARDSAIASETADRNAAIAAETSARNAAINAESTARGNAISAEQSTRQQADAALQSQIDALQGGSGDFLSKSAGGTVSAPVTFADAVTINGGSLTLVNSDFYLPGSNITIDAGNSLFFNKIPNSSGVGDGGFLTFYQNNMLYAVHISQADRDAYNADVAANGKEAADATREFSLMVLGSTNDPANASNADNVAIEPAADLFLNPGWTGQGAARTQNIGISSVYVGDGIDWRIKMERANGNITTKGRIDADGDIVGLSDESVKDNVTQITGALDKIEALTGVLYTRNDMESDRTHMGLIAQATMKAAPEVVFDRADGKLGVAYGNLVALLVEGIKELRAEIETLKKG